MLVFKSVFQCNNNQKYLFVGIARSFSRLNLKKPRAFYITVFLKKSVKHYSYKDACWVALSLIWVQYRVKYARSNGNGFKRVWVFLMCAYVLLQYGKIWLITTYILSKWLYGQKKGLEVKGFDIWSIAGFRLLQK